MNCRSGVKRLKCWNNHTPRTRGGKVTIKATFLIKSWAWLGIHRMAAIPTIGIKIMRERTELSMKTPSPGFRGTQEHRLSGLGDARAVAERKATQSRQPLPVQVKQQPTKSRASLTRDVEGTAPPPLRQRSHTDRR